MSSKSENLKIIFFEPASENAAGHIIADGYFSFVPTFAEGDSINITLSRRESVNKPVSDPIGHKTHRVVKMDWVMLIDERSKEALATLVVSVTKIMPVETPVAFPDIVATH